MTTSIIDNSNERGKLADLLKREFKECKEIAIATAYFNIRGFGAIKEGLLSKQPSKPSLVYKTLDVHIIPLTSFIDDKPLKLLLGREPSEEIKWEEKILRELEQELDGEEDNYDYYKLLQECVDYFEDEKREVRLMQGRFFHGKCYIGISDNNGIGVVGSSNFTYGGLVSNRELNMYSKDIDAVNDLYSWFIEQWNSSIDFKDKFLDALKRYVTTYSPYDIIAKALYETYKEQIDLGFERDKNRILANMYKHQIISFISAKQKLDKYNGVIIADSTGLGKTMVALNIIHDMQREGKRCLLIAPKSILDTTWKDEMDKRNIYLHPDYMISMEYISHNPDEVINTINNKEDIGLIVVDEAHYFRNPSSNRHKALKDILARTRAKVVLLTATPINTSLMDLYHLFSFYLPDNCISDIADKGLQKYFINQQKRWLEGKEIDMDDVLQRFMVRHSRQFAKAIAMAENRDIHFPDRRLESIEYNLHINYEEVWNILEQVNFAFYDLALERLSDKFILPDGTPIKSDLYKKRLEDLKRLVKLIIKINIFKRLESSLYSYKETIKRIIEYIDIATKYAKEHGFFIPPRLKGDILQLYDSEEDEEVPDPDVIFEGIEYRDRLKLGREEVDRLISLSNMDKELLTNLINKYDYKNDYKFRDFISYLSKKYDEVKSEKGNGIIIFSQYYDTAIYLYNKIREIERYNNDVMFISGKECKDRGGKNNTDTYIIKDFQNNGGILVTTDKLSAGQNLQNAQYIINYDFPWNPVTLIQRAGRVDRLGSKYSEIYVINVLPTNRNPEDPSSLTHFLSVFEKLVNRLTAINQTIGLDASHLGEHAIPKDFSIYAKIAENDKSVLRLLEKKIEQFTDEPMDLLADIMTDKGLDYLKSLPDGIGAYKKGANKRGLFILFAVYINDKKSLYWRLKFFDKDAVVITNSREIIDTIMKGEIYNNGEKINYDPLLKYMIDMKKELHDEIKSMIIKQMTIGTSPTVDKNTVRKIYVALAKVDEDLAIKFKKHSNKPFIVDTLKRAMLEDRLIEKAREIFANMKDDDNDNSNNISPDIKIKRVCWCYIE